MLHLVDSNVLLRLVQRSDPLYSTAWTAVGKLHRRGDTLAYTSQVLGEFWNVCTRPTTARGGFGLPVAQAERRARLIERHCVFLPDSPATHLEWRRLPVALQVSGVQVHDARLAAAASVHSVSSLITFNSADFTRFPGLVVQDPRSI